MSIHRSITALGRQGMSLLLVSLTLCAGVAAAPTPASAKRLDITFTPFSDDVGRASERETRRLITSAAEYERWFGHAPPADIQWEREWVIFYSAGTQPTGGYEARIASISVVGRTLKVATVLVVPGPACGVTQALSMPSTLVRFARPDAELRQVRFSAQREENPCSEPPTSCAVVLCPVGTLCIESGGTARCVPIGPPCGGTSGASCPGAGTCIPTSGDGCDPQCPTKDCPGMCQCNVIGLCVEGYRWDSSPHVCGCVPVGQGVPCGPVNCAPGLVCCNASCGICTQPGGVCIQIACE